MNCGSFCLISPSIYLHFDIIHALQKSASKGVCKKYHTHTVLYILYCTSYEEARIIKNNIFSIRSRTYFLLRKNRDLLFECKFRLLLPPFLINRF